MKLTVVLRDPGNHHPIWSGDVDAIPRAGDAIELGERVYWVHSVTWLPETNSASALVE